MSLAAEYTAASDPTFIQRVQMAAIAFTVNIVQHEDPSTANHTNRATYAKRITTLPSALWAPALAQGVTALTAVSDGATLTDQQVSDAVATIWDSYAGIV